MKALIALAILASVVYAESDPWYLYGGYGYHGYPYGYAVGRPCVNNAGLAVPCALGHPLVNTQARRKREAESDPWYGYGYYGYPYGVVGRPCVNAAGQAVPCAQGLTWVNTQARRKREAEADPALVYSYPYTYGYHLPLVYGAGLVTKPCVNNAGEKVDCALGHKDIATAHVVPTLVYGRKKREADPVYFSNVKAEVTEHEGKYTVPVATYAHGYWPYGLVPAVGTAEVPYKYNTVAYKSAPVENPSDPTRPELIHTSKLGICLNGYGLQVPC